MSQSYGKISNTIFLGFVSHFGLFCFVLFGAAGGAYKRQANLPGRPTQRYLTAICLQTDTIMCCATWLWCMPLVSPGGARHTQRPQATPQSNGNCNGKCNGTDNGNGNGIGNCNSSVTRSIFRHFAGTYSSECVFFSLSVCVCMWGAHKFQNSQKKVKIAIDTFTGQNWSTTTATNKKTTDFRRAWQNYRNQSRIATIAKAAGHV